MSNENIQLWAELTPEESADVQGGFYFNIPFYSPAIGFKGGGIDSDTPALGSYGSKTNPNNYGFFSAWKSSTDGLTSNGFSAYIPGVTGWWDPSETDPTERAGGKLQVKWP